MKTTPLPTTVSSSASAPEALLPQRTAGRPSALNAQMIDGLCAIIRETGVSDSGAAARMSLHPSTISRWKRDCPDFAILLRTAREDFREAQLAIIMEAARSPKTGWRAAAWFLERVFPQDYAPRAAERAKFQALYEEQCAREVGEETEETMRQSDHETMRGEVRDRGEALQNVQNAAVGQEDEEDATALMQAALDESHQPARLPGRPLQNVQNHPLAGTVRPPAPEVSPRREGPFA